MSLRAQGTLLLAALVVAVGLVSGVAALAALRETTARVEAERREETRGLARRLDALFELGAERMQTVAGQPGLALWLSSLQRKKLPPNAAIPQRETLHYLFLQSEIFTGPVALVDRDGVLLWTEPYDEARISARPVIDIARSRRAVLPHSLPWRTGSAALMVEPILDFSGKSAGALFGEIDFEASRLGGLLKEAQVGTGALVAADGAVLASAIEPGLLESVLPELPAGDGATSVTSRGRSWILARSQLQRAPWSVVTIYPGEAALAPLRALRLRLALGALVLLVAAVAFSILMIGRMVRPIEVLTEAARGVPLGDFRRPVPTRAPGELGDLAEAFSGMRSDLQATLLGLQESEERYRRSIDLANDPILAVDAARRRVQHANKRALAAGIKAGIPFTEVFAAGEKAAAEQLFARVAAEGEGSASQLQLASGMPVSVSGSLIEHAAGSFVQLICRDLTERQRMERELVQAEKMSTLGLLTAGLFHELNTPLAYVLANLEMAQEGLDGPKDQLAAMLGDALHGSRRAVGIVKDLRVFARGEGTGKGRFCDLNEAIRMALRMAHYELKTKANVVSELGEVPTVAGTASELSQVFLNLFVNAAHAMDPARLAGNRIVVRTEAVDGQCVATVTDTGSGIPPEALSRIFDAFYTTKPEGVGTGLGLAISRDIVQRCGGTIRVESTPGTGTKFTIEIPLALDP